MKRAMFFLVALAACGAPSSPRATHSGSADADRAAILEVVSECQRAGFEEHDADAYLRYWTDDAALTFGRGPTPGPMDLTLSREQIEATKRIRFAVPATPGQKASMDRQVVTRTGPNATLSWRMTVRSKDLVEVVDEIYTLRRTDAGWKIAGNRYWMVSSGPPGRQTTYDAAHWSERDRAVRAAESADLSERIDAWVSAMRYSEAHAALANIDSDAAADLWAARASLAMTLGNTADATNAACQARRRGAGNQLANWAEPLQCP